MLLVLLLLQISAGLVVARGYDPTFPVVARQEFLPTDIQHGQCNTTVAIYEDVSTPGVTQYNYNRPLTCWYEFRPTGAPSSDYVIDIRIKRFNVGRVFNSSYCQGGYVQIIDGSSETAMTNHLSPGFFCGEMQDSRNFISETNTVKLVFHADNFTEDTYLSFFSRTELTRALHERYGKQPELYPGGRRGDPVGPNNYCERVFNNCRPDSCSVQSPAYPGPYPRNLRCRYHLNVKQAYIRLYTADQQVSIDGQRCDSPMVCPLRPLTSNPARCKRDYLIVYDGKQETDPRIGTFCGFGRFPHSITGSGTNLLVTFTTSPAGPLLNEGFQFTVGSVPGKRDTQGKLEGLCDWVFGARRLRRSGHSGGRFSSLAHWYPANTTCRHLIRAENGQKVRLRFTSFRVDPISAPLAEAKGDCAESLAVYDGAEPRPQRLMRLFCDTFSAPAKSEPIVSSGRTMLVLFSSQTGSYEGSSLFYRAAFDFFREAWWGEPVPDTHCDETFSPWGGTSGLFGGPQNRLVFESAVQLRCRYTFQADRRHFSRVLVNISAVDVRERCSSLISMLDCGRGRSHLVAWQGVSNVSQRAAAAPEVGSHCLCRPSQAPHLVLTDIPEATVELTLSPAAARRALSDGRTVFSGHYHFVHGPFCGAAKPSGGRIRYPALDFQPQRPTYCVWQVAVGPGSDLWFQARELRLAKDCDTDSLTIFTGQFRQLHRLCANDEGASHVVPSGRIASGHVQFHFRSVSPSAKLLVQWAVRPAAGDAVPAASGLVAVETVTAPPETTTPRSVSAEGVVSRWREIGMVGGAAMTLCCLAAAALWWCRGRRICPAPGQEEACLTSETEPAEEEADVQAEASR